MNSAMSQSNSHEKCPYKAVKVLMLVWNEGERKNLRELERLKEVFDDYKFSTTLFRIPSWNSQVKVAEQIDLLQSCDPLTLLIVYYSGHGRFDYDRSKNEFSLAFLQHYGTGPDPPYVEWLKLQPKLLQSNFDCLIILDTCRAGGALDLETSPEQISSRPPLPRKELLASAGFSSTTNSAGNHSFTHALIEELQRRADSAEVFSTGTLNKHITLYLAECWRNTAHKKGRSVQPVHVKLGGDTLLPDIPLRTFKFDNRRQDGLFDTAGDVSDRMGDDGDSDDSDGGSVES